MAVYAGPDIVEDGLVYAMDPGNTKSFRTGSSAIRNAVQVTTISGNEGSIGNGAFFSPLNGGIFSRDGTNDTIAVPYGIGWCPQGINGPSNMTLSFWFYAATLPNNAIVKLFNSGDGKYNYALSISYFSLGAASGHGLSSSSWGGNIQLNVWQNFCFSVSTSTLKIYRNGVLKSTTSHGITTAFSETYGPSWEMYVGLGGWPFQGNMQGYIGPLHFYHRVLTDSEVQQNFNVLEEDLDYELQQQRIYDFQCIGTTAN